MKEDGVLVQTLSRALEWMPNISCITYSPLPHHLPTEATERKTIVRRSLSSIPGSDFTASDHPFRRLIAALCLSQFTGIRELKADYVGKDITDPGTEFALSIFDLDENEMEAAKFVFQGFEKLDLNMALRGSDQETFGEVMDKFATLLRSTTQLQHLYFHPTHWKSDVGPQPLFERLGLGTTWPNLQTLGLKGVFATENELIGVVKRHKPTLTEFTFTKCSLLEGTWAEIVDEVVYGTTIRRFVLNRVNERGLPYLDYATMGTSERDSWRYQGRLKVTKDGERSFVRMDFQHKGDMC